MAQYGAATAAPCVNKLLLPYWHYGTQNEKASPLCRLGWVIKN